MDLMKIIEKIKQFQEEFPVDIRGIAKTLDIAVHEDDRMDDSISGLIKYEGENIYSIHVNSHNSLTRKRFTIAHELGHWWHHKDEIMKAKVIEEDFLYRSTKKELTSNLEAQANKFAAELLMPRHLIIGFLRKHKKDADRVVFKLAKKMDMSLEATEYRLESLGLSVYFNVTQNLSSTSPSNTP